VPEGERVAVLFGQRPAGVACPLGRSEGRDVNGEDAR